MKAKIFQFLNFAILKPCLTRYGRKGIDRYERWFTAQIKLAEIMGGAKAVIIGDSNAEVFCSRRCLSRTSKIILAMGKGGTTSYDWLSWFTTPSGEFACKYLKAYRPSIIWNIGGNHVLLNLMDSAEHGLKTLHDIFPTSYNCTIPPVRLQWLESIQPAVNWDLKFKLVNGYIRSTWEHKTIELHNMTENLDPEIKELCLKDVVHYSRLAVDFIFGFLKYL